MTAEPTHPIGAHIPASGGLARTGLPYLAKVGATAAQVFVSNPRGWALSSGNPAEDEAFRAHCEPAGIPVFVHASLLVNLGSPTALTVERSAATLLHAAERAQRIGASAGVFHSGSAVAGTRRDAAMAQLREVLLPILDSLDKLGDDAPGLLVEPTAGGGFSLAAKVGDLGPFFEAVDHHPRLGVCLDTCHAWAAGHDLTAPGGTKEMLDDLAGAVGTGRLRLIHANDSKDPCGSLRDRHENVGAGQIGLEPFGDLFTHPETRGVPLIVETPSHTEGAGHIADITSLRGLLAQLG
ncbi:MAG: deoxyribonuclease [Cryptosporangiaceae bacterium]|nr:deoxyribonuclease [Cryptosporangiaceae bacterium]